jgi:hypothetical protein
LSPGSVIEIKHKPLDASGTLYQPTFVRKAHELTWEMICKAEFDYILSTAKSGLPTCRGCGQKFSDKNEPRVTTTIAYKALNMGPVLATIHFCINMYPI